MHKIVLLLKTYQEDACFVRLLVASILKFNRDNIPLYIVCPDEEVHFFRELCGKSVGEVIRESTFSKYLTVAPLKLNGLDAVFSPGYVNQEIVKLAFWELNIAENYICIDSDAQFIRDFYLTDFLAPDGMPYTFLSEDFPLLIDKFYYSAWQWESRKALIERINKEIDYHSPLFITSHGNVTFNSSVLKNFHENFMKTNQYSYIDLIKISPYEFSWYNMWLQKTKHIPIHQREPIILYFHHENQLRHYRSANITLDDLKRSYVGIIINSNFQRDRKKNPILYESYTDFVPQYDDTKALIYILRRIFTLSIKTVFVLGISTVKKLLPMWLLKFLRIVKMHLPCMLFV